jgi:hypothetical protein
MANFAALIVDAGGLRQVTTGDVLTAPGITLDTGVIASAVGTDLTLTAASGKNVKLSGQKFPSADGTASQMLTTNGAGTLSWQTHQEGSGFTKWVATDGSDDTGNGSEGNPYATITKAFDDIKTRQYEEGAIVIIQLKEGRYTPGSLTNISEFKGRLRIQGPTSYSFTMSEIVSVVDQGSNNYDVRITLDSTTGLAVDMFVVITACTNPISLNGCHKILAVNSSTDITIRVVQTSSSISAGSYSCNVKVPKARIYHNSSVIQFVSCLFVDLYDLVLEGNASGAAISATAVIRLYAPATLGIYNFATALNATSLIRGEILGCGISNLVAGTGLNVSSSFISFQGAITGCDYAINPSHHSTVIVSASSYLGNNTYGILTSCGDVVYLHTVQVFNNVIGLYADNMSLIHGLYSVTYTNNGTNTSPALNTIGNNNSYIRGPA